jgi:hypothetical protein
VKLQSLLPSELAAIPDPKPIWVPSPKPGYMPDPWPAWETHSRYGAFAHARPLPCSRCQEPRLADHTCKKETAPVAPGAAPDPQKEIHS